MEADQCDVCMNAPADRSLTCGHTLCAACMRDWLCRSATCPKCREPVFRVAPPTPFRFMLHPHAPFGLNLTTTPSGRVVLRAVVPRSTADLEGLVPGDRVLRINGDDVNSSDVAASILSTARVANAFSCVEVVPRRVVCARRADLLAQGVPQELAFYGSVDEKRYGTWLLAWDRHAARDLFDAMRPRRPRWTVPCCPCLVTDDCVDEAVLCVVSDEMRI
jgi:hypothetical protein